MLLDIPALASLQLQSPILSGLQDGSPALLIFRPRGSVSPQIPAQRFGTPSLPSSGVWLFWTIQSIFISGVQLSLKSLLESLSLQHLILGISFSLVSQLSVSPCCPLLGVQLSLCPQLRDLYLPLTDLSVPIDSFTVVSLEALSPQGCCRPGLQMSPEPTNPILVSPQTHHPATSTYLQTLVSPQTPSPQCPCSPYHFNRPCHPSDPTNPIP